MATATVGSLATEKVARGARVIRVVIGIRLVVDRLYLTVEVFPDAEQIRGLVLSM